MTARAGPPRGRCRRGCRGSGRARAGRRRRRSRRCRRRRRRRDQLDAGRRGRRARTGRPSRASRRPGVEWLRAQAGRARPQPVERAELADEPLEPGRLLGDRLRRPRRVVAGRRAVGEGRREAADHRQRRPQVVAQVGQQLGLAGPRPRELGGHGVEPARSAPGPRSDPRGGAGRRRGHREVARSPAASRRERAGDGSRERSRRSARRRASVTRITTIGSVRAGRAAPPSPRRSGCEQDDARGAGRVRAAQRRARVERSSAPSVKAGSSPSATSPRAAAGRSGTRATGSAVAAELHDPAVGRDELDRDAVVRRPGRGGRRAGPQRRR